MILKKSDFLKQRDLKLFKVEVIEKLKKPQIGKRDIAQKNQNIYN